MWYALSAETSVLNESPKLIEKYHVIQQAVRSDAKANHAELITIFPIIVGEVE